MPRQGLDLALGGIEVAPQQRLRGLEALDDAEFLAHAARQRIIRVRLGAYAVHVTHFQQRREAHLVGAQRSLMVANRFSERGDLGGRGQPALDVVRPPANLARDPQCGHQGTRITDPARHGHRLVRQRQAGFAIHRPIPLTAENGQ